MYLAHRRLAHAATCSKGITSPSVTPKTGLLDKKLINILNSLLTLALNCVCSGNLK